MSLTLRLAAAVAEDVAWAAELLSNGGVVAFPTDTVYGLGTTAWRPDSIARLYAAKERPPDKAIPILAADLSAARGLVSAEPPGLSRLARRYWPGPLTLVMPASPRVPEIVSAGTGTVALRVPALEVTLALLRRSGPLAVTSANRSGWADAVSAADVLAQLDGRIDAVLDGGRCPGGAPSTVFDLTVDPPRVLRAGPVSEEELERELREGQGG